MRRLLTFAVALSGFVGIGTAASPSASATDVTAHLPFVGFSDMLVDESTGHLVFATGGDSVWVTDLSGGNAQEVTGFFGAWGLAESGTTVYVSESTINNFATIDLSAPPPYVKSATELLISGLTNAPCPQAIALTADKLWFGYGCTGSPGDVGNVDLGVGHAVQDGIAGGVWTTAPIVRAAGNVVTAGARTTTGAEVRTYDASTGGQIGDVTACADVRDIAVTTTHVALACAGSSAVAAYPVDSGDGIADITYATSGGSPRAVAVSPDGAQIVAGMTQHRPNVTEFAVGDASSPTASYALAGSSGPLPRALRLGASGTLYALVPGASYSDLVVLQGASLYGPGNIHVSTSAGIYRYGAHAKVVVHLAEPSYRAQVTLYATPYNGTRKVVARGTVNSYGNLVAYVTVTRRTLFTSVFAGDYRFSSARDTQTVRVRAKVAQRLSGYYTTKAGTYLYHSTDDPRLHARLYPNQNDVCLYFRAQRYYSGRWHTVALSPCYRTDGYGRYTATFRGDHFIGKPYRVRAEWHGNTVALARSGSWLRVKFWA